MAGQALAVYIRIAVSRDSAFDAWNAGDDSAISSAAERGLELFRGKAGCIRCHRGPQFTDYEFHALGVGSLDESGALVDQGRARVTGQSKDRGAFLTPTLRSVVRSAPFFHDGSQGDIRRVIARHFEDETVGEVERDSLLRDLQPLSSDEIELLVEFLRTLDGAPLERDTLSEWPEFPD